MKRPSTLCPRWLCGLLLTLPGLAGCPGDSWPDDTSTAFCDQTGCWICDADKQCTPVDKAGCAVDGQCAAGEVCSSIGCTRPCTSDAGCLGLDRCLDGFCAPRGFWKVSPYEPPDACASDDGCMADQWCKTGICVPRCKSDDDCGPDLVCAACGKCQPQSVPATCGATPVYCSAQVTCGLGKSCVQGRCHVQCSAGAICPVGQLCQAGLCLDDPAPAAPSCWLDLDCAAGLCINGACHPRCTTSAQCGPNSLCLMGVCQPDYFPAG